MAKTSKVAAVVSTDVDQVIAVLEDGTVYMGTVTEDDVVNWREGEPVPETRAAEGGPSATVT